MPIRDEDRERVVREIVRSAAVVLACPVESLSVATVASERGTVRAVVRAEGRGETWLGASGASEGEALGALLSRAVARASGPVAAPLVMTPALERAIALLRLSRAELEALVRAETATKPGGG